MKCDKCDKEATVHEVMIRGGKRSERHLCEQHAKEEGVAPSAAPVAPIAQIVSKFIAGSGLLSDPAAAGQPPASPGKATAAKANQCPSCGLSFAQFRQVGLLGCPECYEAFESQLGPLLARAHEGGTLHVGRAPEPEPARPAHSDAPSRASDERAERTLAARQSRIDALKLRLAEAVGLEQYEKAAAIRDELAALAAPPPAAGAGKAASRRAKREPRSPQEPQP